MDFCGRMCAKLLLSEVQTGSNRNIVVSPLSFHAILNMIAAGASGSTLDQMLSFLGCSSIHDMKSKFSRTVAVASGNKDDGDGDGDGPIVTFVNGVWVDKRFPLKNSYRKFVTRCCKRAVKNVDFATQADEIVKEANLWAKNETRGLITDVLDPRDIDPLNTICVLGNALSKEKVDSSPGFLTQDFKLWNEKLDSFWIPKFKFSYSTDQGKQMMIKMGLTRPFSKACREMTEVVKIDDANKPLYFSKVVQKAFIEIDEEGTEAAAVTFAVQLECCSRRTRVTEVLADHPFMFLIREENSRSVLFVGAVLNPRSGDPEMLGPESKKRRKC